MITARDFKRIVKALGQQAVDDIEWANSCVPPAHPDDFATEVIFVICNSGMKNTVARKIYNRIGMAIMAGKSASTVFGHRGKAAAIDDIWSRRHSLWQDYLDASDKLAFCATLPWIGDVTKYHIVKNFGAQVAKPDIHLQRLADHEGTTAQVLCERLSNETGYTVAAIDTVLWRACANGIIDSRTGAMSL